MSENNEMPVATGLRQHEPPMSTLAMAAALPGKPKSAASTD